MQLRSYMWLRIPLLVGAALTLGCAAEPEAPPPNIVLVLVDTVRADSLRLEDSDPDLTPSIRDLAREGVVFDAAFTHSTWTKPAIATLFTSRFPTQHTVRLVAYEQDGHLVSGRLPDEVTTLAERLQAGGYRTLGIVNQTHLRPKFGFGQGFDEYYAFRGKGAQHLNGVLQNWLGEPPAEAEGRPLFLYMHYLDPHWPYRERVEGLREEIGSLYMESEPPLNGQNIDRWLEGGLTEEAITALKARYQHGVAYADRAVGRALELLEENGRLADSVIVLTSDHGEGFYEHGELLHGYAPYEEVHRIPLIFRLPTGEPGGGRRLGTPVGLVDVMPTLLDVAGLELIPGDMGRSLLSLLRGGTTSRVRPVFGETEDIRSLRTDRHKLIRFPDGREEFYDLVDDPLEASPLDCDATCQELGAQLDELTALLASQAMDEAGAVELDDEDLERLRALGYLD